MTKFIIIALVILAAVALVACVSSNNVLNEIKTYDIASDIRSLNIEVNAADFTIEQGDEFSVESNLRYLTVSDNGGVLKIKDETKISLGYANAVLKLYVPAGTVFEDAKINTGAGRLTAEKINANTLELKTGAGKVEFASIEATEKIDIKGGAGSIEIKDGTLNNLNLDLGVGNLDMTAELRGENNLKFGVGHSGLTLKGDKDDYRFDVETGIGKVSIDGRDAFSFANSGNGENSVKIKGGVGATDINFK